MIRIKTDNLFDAKSIATSKLRTQGLRVAVYRTFDKSGFLVLDEAGCKAEAAIGPLEPRLVFNPERRASQRVSCHIPVQVEVPNA